MAQPMSASGSTCSWAWCGRWPWRGSLDRARHHRAEAIALAERVDEPALTARVIGAFDVPALWTDNDDLDLARHIAEVTERTLAALPPENTAVAVGCCHARRRTACHRRRPRRCGGA